jgi:hypothetical protein
LVVLKLGVKWLFLCSFRCKRTLNKTKNKVQQISYYCYLFYLNQNVPLKFLKNLTRFQNSLQ